GQSKQQEVPDAPRPAPAFEDTPLGVELPYGITSRPMPQGENIDALLPRQVGPFVREPIQPVAKGAPIYGNYRSGAATVFVELGICDSAHDALAVLDTAKDEASGERETVPPLYVKRAECGCFKSVSENGAFIAWTRGRYFFSAHAKSGEGDLE